MVFFKSTVLAFSLVSFRDFTHSYFQFVFRFREQSIVEVLLLQSDIRSRMNRGYINTKVYADTLEPLPELR